jgi:hypothetical protein
VRLVAHRGGCGPGKPYQPIDVNLLLGDEGDWEMIQLDFDASTAAEALRQEPVEVGYSQH